MIPKIFNCIFFYDEKKPMALNINHYICLRSQLKNNRDCRLKVHTNREDIFKKWKGYLLLKEEFGEDVELIHRERPVEYKGNKIPSAIAGSDIARFTIMKDFGGVYLDMDMLSLKPIPEEYWYSERVLQSIEADTREFTPTGLGSAFLMSPKGSAWWDLLLEQYERYEELVKLKGEFFPPVYLPFELSRTKQYLIHVLPSEAFLPIYFFYEECEDFFFLDRYLNFKHYHSGSYEVHLWENRNKVVMKYLSKRYFEETNTTYSLLVRSMELLERWKD